MTPPAVVAFRRRVREGCASFFSAGQARLAQRFKLAAAGSIDVVAPAHAELDLKDLTAIGRIVGAGVCDTVINTAAYTDVDRAESEEDWLLPLTPKQHPELQSKRGLGSHSSIFPPIMYSTDARANPTLSTIRSDHSTHMVAARPRANMASVLQCPAHHFAYFMGV